MESSLAIGIDLGTTFSSVAVYKDGKSEIIASKKGDRLTPSLVFYHPNSLNVSVGQGAYDIATQRIENFLFDIKRLIGRKYDDVYVQKLIQSEEYKYNIIRGENDTIEIQLMYDGVTVSKSPEQISSEILRHLKESACEYLGCAVTEAVISVPAYFSNAQRKATKAAAELAGLKVLKLVTEPVAAAIHYAKERLEKPSTLLVFDFGGGTLDVSIIEVSGKAFAVKSVEGDTFLGGRDYDHVLFEHFKSDIIQKFGKEVFNDRLSRRVQDACTRLKKELSFSTSYSLPIYCIGGDENAEFIMSMTRKDFEKRTQHLFKRAEAVLNKCLEATGLRRSDINDIILVGGTSRLPKLREMLVSYFGGKDLKTDLNPDDAVALGAAVQAALYKQNCRELEKYRITEITPLAIGLCYDGGLMSPAILKNTPLPAISKPLLSVTVANDQKTTCFKVFEGERLNCEFNNFLGELVIENLPQKKAGDVEFEVIFKLNEDGILEVEAQECGTGIKAKLTVTIGEFHLCDREIRMNIADAEKNKKDDFVFEKFWGYLWIVRNICNHIKYELDKVPNKKHTVVIRQACSDFMRNMEMCKYTEIDKLKGIYEDFEKVVRPFVEPYIDVKFEVLQTSTAPTSLIVPFERSLKMYN